MAPEPLARTTPSPTRSRDVPLQLTAPKVSINLCLTPRTAQYIFQGSAVPTFCPSGSYSEDVFGLTSVSLCRPCPLGAPLISSFGFLVMPRLCRVLLCRRQPLHVQVRTIVSLTECLLTISPQCWDLPAQLECDLGFPLSRMRCW